MSKPSRYGIFVWFKRFSLYLTAFIYDQDVQFVPQTPRTQTPSFLSATILYALDDFVFSTNKMFSMDRNINLNSYTCIY